VRRFLEKRKVSAKNREEIIAQKREGERASRERPAKGDK